MIQCTIESLEEKIDACAFTGHRELGEDFCIEELNKAIDECIKRGCQIFYTGMAKGFDLIAAKEIVKRKKAGVNVRLYACIPYEKQSKSYSDEDKKLYEEILQNADEKKVFFEDYTKWCMMTRNQFMADRADVLIAFLKKEKGGTYQTVKYFIKKKKGYVFYV